MKKKILYWIISIVIIQFPVSVLAAEGGDVTVSGIELDKLLNLGSALLATALFILTLIAYNRKKSQRLLYVSIAFLIFALKGFLISMEIVFGDLGWIDPVATILDFAMLLSFFFGILKK